MLLLLAAWTLGLAEPPAPKTSPSVECPVASSGEDWTGRYEAGEGTPGPPPMVMSYRADVFRDAEGRWRAFVWVSGQTTFRELRACGVAKRRSLELRGRPRVPEVEDEAPESILTIERTTRGTLRFRIPGGSYLLNAPVIEAERKALPPWAGVYTADTCARANAPCWRYRFDVSLQDDGWRALIAVEGPETTERLVARGEDGELVDSGDVLFLAYVAAAPGDARRGSARKAQDSTGKLVRRKDGSTWLELAELPGPAGVREVPVTVQTAR